MGQCEGGANATTSTSLLVMLAVSLVTLLTAFAACAQPAPGSPSPPKPLPAPAPSPSPALAAKPTPTPGVIEVSGVINTEGLFTRLVTAKSEDGKVQLIINAYTRGKTKEGTALTRISIAPLAAPPAPPAGASFIGAAYDLGPEGATFVPPVTLSFTYDPQVIPAGLDQKKLVLAYFDKGAGEWVALKGVTVDPATHTVLAKISHFGTFTIIAYTRPAAFTASALTISPAEVSTGERVSISLLITNVGDLGGSYGVVLKVANVITATENVTMAGQTSRKVAFSIRPDAAGSHAVSVDGLSGILTVKSKWTPTPTPKSTPAPTPTPSQPPPAPTASQSIQYVIPAASWAGRSVSFTRLFDGGEKIEGSVEISSQSSSSDLRDDWYFDILGPDGKSVYSWQGQWRQNNSHRFSYTASSAGRYWVKVTHHSNYQKSLFIRITPPSWVRVSEGPTLFVNPTSLDFGATETQKVFNISNIGGGTLTWYLTMNQAWLSVSSTSGSGNADISVGVKRAGLKPGPYSDTITINSNVGTRTVRVSMSVK